MDRIFNMEGMLDKSQIRKQMREKRDALSLEDIRTKSSKLFGQIEKSTVFLSVNDILIYVSYKSEVYTHEFIKKCLFLHKNVFVPKVYGTMMQFIKIEQMEDLTEGAYGIFEPVKDAPIWNDNHLKNNVWSEENALSEEHVLQRTDALSKENIFPKAMMILPALAVDMHFNRVGYGGGYYDKYLAIHSNIIRIAAVFDFQVMHTIQTEENDKKVDMIVTEENIYKEEYDGFN